MARAVSEFRLAMQAAGFDPIPVKGKHPIINAWQTKFSIGADEIMSWGGAGTGMLCRKTPTLDGDITIPEAANDVEALARDFFDGRGQILVRFGNVPKRAIPFRTAEPFSKKVIRFVAPNDTKQKLEFLGDGQQVVVDGTHPETGKPYSWHGGRPGTVRWEDLPPITEKEAEEFMELAATMLCEQHGFRRVEETAPKSNGHAEAAAEFTADPLDVEDKLELLDDAAAEDAGAIVNDVQMRVIAGLLRKGEHPSDVLTRIVDETMARAGDRLGWTRNEEIKRVIKRILSAYKNLLLKDYDPASGVIPDWLPGEYHEVWVKVLEAGRRPDIGYNRGGFYIRSYGVKAAVEDERPEADAKADAKADTTADDAKPTSAKDSAKSGKQGGQTGQAPQGIRAIPFAAFDEATLPPREWLYANHYQRGQVTATIGPGGAGKSTEDLVEAIAMATGRNLLGEQPTIRCRVWVHNGDDDDKEMKRRIAAVCRHYKIPMAELEEGWLFVTTKNDMEIKLGAGNGALAVNRVAVNAIISTILQNQIDVFIAEPLVTLHSVPENDNNKMNAIVHLLGGIAGSCDCAIEICHHTRKLLAGVEGYNTDDGRGASAIRDAVRGSRVLNSLTRAEAQEVGIEEQERAFYFRIDRGKANYLPPATKATWRKFENVELLNGDQVGVVTVWEFPGQGAATPKKAAAEQKAEHVFLELLDKFAARGVNVSASSGPNYAPAKFADEREAKTGKVSKAALKAAMDRLLDAGRIRTEEDPSKRSRRRLAVCSGDEQ